METRTRSKDHSHKVSATPPMENLSDAPAKPRTARKRTAEHTQQVSTESKRNQERTAARGRGAVSKQSIRSGKLPKVTKRVARKSAAPPNGEAVFEAPASPETTVVVVPHRRRTEASPDAVDPSDNRSKRPKRTIRTHNKRDNNSSPPIAEQDEQSSLQEEIEGDDKYGKRISKGGAQFSIDETEGEAPRQENDVEPEDAMDGEDRDIQRLLLSFGEADPWPRLVETWRTHGATLEQEGYVSDGRKLNYDTEVGRKLDRHCKRLLRCYRAGQIPERFSNEVRGVIQAMTAVSDDLDTTNISSTVAKSSATDDPSTTNNLKKKKRTAIFKDFEGPGIHRLVGVVKQSIVANMKGLGERNEDSLANVLVILNRLVELCDEVRSRQGLGGKKATPYLKDLSITRKQINSVWMEENSMTMDLQRRNWVIENRMKRQQAMAEKEPIREQEIQMRSQRILDEVNQSFLRGRFDLYERTPRVQNTPVAQHAPEWTREQDYRLLVLLSTANTSNLPLAQRYMQFLADENFQNLLPEHIQNRAIELKDAMIAEFEERGQEVPRWVSSIDRVFF